MPDALSLGEQKGFLSVREGQRGSQDEDARPPLYQLWETTVMPDGRHLGELKLNWPLAESAGQACEVVPVQPVRGS
jgi:hypothetical protein